MGELPIEHEDELRRLMEHSLEQARAICWCAGYRKPCQYHEGWGDGIDSFLDLLMGERFLRAIDE